MGNIRGFNPLQNLLQGSQARQQMDVMNLKRQLAEQGGGAFSPTAQKLTAYSSDPIASIANLESGRFKALQQDARSVYSLLARPNPDPQAAMSILQERKSAIGGGDSQHTNDAINTLAADIQTGDFANTIQGAMTYIGMKQKDLKKPTAHMQDYEYYKSLPKDEQKFFGETINPRDRQSQLNYEQIKQQLIGDIKTEQIGERGVDAAKVEAGKARFSANNKRISMLSKGAAGRKQTLKQAKRFLDLFKSGEARSGAGRQAAKFIPGIYTSQGQFDEQIDAFQIVGAMAKLKATGQTKITDADMEQALKTVAGSEKDEQTNIRMLESIIGSIEYLDDEFIQMKGAHKDKTLDQFIYTPQGGQEQQLSDEDLLKKYGG